MGGCGPTRTRPRLIAPDVAAFHFEPPPPYFEAMLRGIQPNVLSALTFHQYPYCIQRDRAEGNVLSLSYLARLTQALRRSARWRAATASWWAGERNCWSGGIAGVTDAYVDVFYYAFQLQTMARHASPPSCGRRSSRRVRPPRRARAPAEPRLRIALLWARLVASRTLDVTMRHPDHRRRATCASPALREARRKGGDIIVVVINFALNQTINLEMSEALLGERRAGDTEGGVRWADPRWRQGRWHAPQSRLAPDGSAAELARASPQRSPLRPRRDGTLPELLPTPRGTPVRIPPASVAFLQPHGARTAACS